MTPSLKSQAPPIMGVCTGLISGNSGSSNDMVSSHMAHLLVCPSLEASFADNHSEGEEAEVVVGAGS